MTSTSSLACLAVASRLLVTALAVLLHGVVRSSDASGQLRSSHCHKTDSSIPRKSTRLWWSSCRSALSVQADRFLMQSSEVGKGQWLQSFTSGIRCTI